MSTGTKWDQEQHAREVAATRRRRYNTDRDALMRACPAGMALDPGHLASMLRQGWNSNKPFLMARHFAVVGLRRAGFATGMIADALNLTPEKVGEEEARVIWWSPPDEMIAGMGDTAREVYGATTPPTP